MSHRSLIFIGGILVFCSFLLAGCGGSGGSSPIQNTGGNQGGGGTPVTYTNITSADGNAQLGDPSSGGIPVSQVTIVPTSASPQYANAIPGTFYTITGQFPTLPPGTDGSPPSVFKISIKFDPSKLPAGVSPSQLLIVSNSGTPVEQFLTRSTNNTTDTTQDTITGMTDHGGTYGLTATVPFSGTNILGHFTGSTQGTLDFDIDPTGLIIAVTTVNNINSGGSGFAIYTGATNFQIGPPQPNVVSNFVGNFQGTIQKSGNTVTGSGTWSNSGGSGTWSIP